MTVKIKLAGILIQKINHITKKYYKNLTKWLNMPLNSYRRKNFTLALDPINC